MSYPDLLPIVSFGTIDRRPQWKDILLWAPWSAGGCSCWRASSRIKLRLEGISTVEAANRFLESFVPDLNSKFAVPAGSETDVHRPLTPDICLESVFSFRQTRRLNPDLTLRFQNRRLQLEPDRAVPKVGSSITVELWQDGTLHLTHQGRRLRFHELTERPAKASAPPQEQAPARPKEPPGPEHPWRERKSHYPEPWRFAERAEALALAYLPLTGVKEIDTFLQAEEPAIVPDGLSARLMARTRATWG